MGKPRPIAPCRNEHHRREPVIPRYAGSARRSAANASRRIRASANWIASRRSVLTRSVALTGTSPGTTPYAAHGRAHPYPVGPTAMVAPCTSPPTNRVCPLTPQLLS